MLPSIQCLLLTLTFNVQTVSDWHTWLQAVEEVLEVLGQDSAQQVPCPSWHYQDESSETQPSGNDQAQLLPLAEALTKCYDLRSGSLNPSFHPDCS